MNFVLLHEDSTLARHIEDNWKRTHGESPELHLTQTGSLDDLKNCLPNLVVLASDQPSEFEQTVLAKCRQFKLRVLSVLGRGSTVLLGPLETPGIPGCTTCLQLRFDNTFDRSFMNAIFNLQDSPVDMPLEMTETDLVTLADIATQEIESILSDAPTPPNCREKVGVYKPPAPVEWVPLIPNHDCPRCDLMPADSPALAQFDFSSHVIKNMDTLRVGTIDCTRLQALFVHPDVGYISAINAFANEGRYVQANAYICTPDGDDIAGYGSGLTLVDAKQSAILEALERSCGVQAVNRRPVVFQRYCELAAPAVHPSQFGFHLPQLYKSSHSLIPFAEDRSYSWIWAYSTKQRQPLLIPEQVAYYGPTADEKRFIIESSNGCALGGTVEEAVLHGLFEVLERDGFLNMWYGKMPAPELKLDDTCPRETSDVLHYLSEVGFEVRLFDISHDLSIPAVCAVGINMANDYPKVVSGAAGHLNHHQAVYGALRELSVQVMNLLQAPAEKHEHAVPMFFDASKIKTLHDHVAVAALPEAYPRWDFLLRQTNAAQIRSVSEAYAGVDMLYQMKSRDIRVVLSAVLDDLHSRGFDVIVVNQSSPEVSHGGFYAVKTLIPGMTPITFGYGTQRIEGLTRLFELPHRLGYSYGVLSPQDLNQDCHPFS
ncbi:TOMM precursor leader peptide-binding protein [Alicyclobacillus sp. ALC3]|uniref:TOMM precursor leader peptide-binding protein n=1 Tax=Alicyclobacillus sp. ALC3 TaxID=2796143 RepID=UPI00237877C1|nr:TOMM precursor leader peptide-binding protein [Alicyclobacillus sp. ALC3]WDL98357.1 TOMM precursor leader peptide-binding protein [Alicyclobacillus sp. ALC3]